jgi:hypothetical protein
VSSIDASELQALSASIASASKNLPREARAVVSKGALNVKNDARERVSDHPSWKRLANTINYDLTGNAFFSAAEIGYDDVGQGELAGIAEFGSARKAPHPALMPAFAAEGPKFTKALADVGAKVLRDAL